jgi:hypothetical protein
MGSILNQQGMINDFSKIILDKEVELAKVQNKFFESISCQDEVKPVF